MVVAGRSSTESGVVAPVTVIMSTSPVPSNPDTAIIEETVRTVRERLPDAPIIVTADGIRPEQEDHRATYTEFVARVHQLAATEWSGVTVQAHDTFQQQTGMTRVALQHVHTPVLFYVEHDLPLRGDIPFEGICKAIVRKKVDVMRLTLNTALEPAHAHMRLEEIPLMVEEGVPAVRTWQWSQQPHLASTAYYREIFARYVKPDQKTYIEWVMSGVLVDAWLGHKMAGWSRHKVWLYTPEGDTSRCYHLNGRAGDKVFNEQGVEQ